MKPTQLVLAIGALCSHQTLYAQETRAASSDHPPPTASLIHHPNDNAFIHHLPAHPHDDSIIHSARHTAADSIKMVGKFFARNSWYDDFNPATNRPPLQGKLAGNRPHLFWFYRLQSSLIAPLPPDPDLIDPELDGNPPPPVLPRPRPQIPAYAALPAALFGMDENLQVRFIDDAQLAGKEGRPNLFISGFHLQERYHSEANQNQSDNRYDGWLVGLRGLLTEDEQRKLALSVAINQGRFTFEPTSSSGSSHGQFDTQGIHALLSWQQPRGLQLALPLGVGHYRGNISSDEQENVAQVKARSANLGIEVGWRWQHSAHAFTPILAATAQWARIKDIHDNDNLRIRYSQQRQLQLSGGLKYDFRPTDALTFGAETRYVQYSGHAGHVAVNKDNLRTGRGGEHLQLSGYVAWQLTDNVQLNGQIKRQHRLGQEGASNWQTQLGVQIAF
jgi:outer membrane autotransporter protein